MDQSNMEVRMSQEVANGRFLLLSLMVVIWQSIAMIPEHFFPGITYNLKELDKRVIFNKTMAMV